jgi:uracil-DNA glycosylase
MLYLSSFSTLSNKWQEILNQKIDCLNNIDKKLVEISLTNKIFPDKNQIFAALTEFEPDQIKLVIIGQDPYHGDGQANGKSFAVADNIRPLPPSLYNIYTEILLNNLEVETLEPIAKQFLENFKNSNGSKQKKIIEGLHHRMINKWPKQGVLLLNTSLTVIAHNANSLQNLGWQEITSYIIEQVSLKNKHCVFMLWGNYAKSLHKNIHKSDQHLILKAVHPSPLSAHRGFIGCKHFIQANSFLTKYGIEKINWISNLTS